MGQGVRALLTLIAFGAPALALAQTEAPVTLKPSAALLETLPEAAQADLQPWKDMVAKRASAQAAIADLTQSVQ